MFQILEAGGGVSGGSRPAPFPLVWQAKGPRLWPVFIRKLPSTKQTAEA